MENYKGVISTHKIFDSGFFPEEELAKLELDNPEYFKNARMGISTKGIPRKIQLWSEKDGKLYIPRSVEVGVPMKDLRSRGKRVKFSFKGSLREEQIAAVDDLSMSTGGILQAGCGTGKTVMSLASVAKVGTTTLVLVHKEFLLNQWVERIEEFLGEKAGIVRGDTWDWKGKKIVVAMLQTLYSRRDSIPEDFLTNFGLTISDEVHRVAADTWSKVVTAFPSYRRWGLTATIERTDNLQGVFLAHIGSVVHTLKGKELKPQVVKIGMNYDFNVDQFRNRFGNRDINIPKLVTAISQIPQRNKLILDVLLRAATKGRKVIVFSERVAHLEELNEKFTDLAKPHGIKCGLFIGKMSQDARDIVAEECEVLFATYQIAKEALDIPDLDTCILATPVSNQITIQQGVGRITRQHPAKQDPLVIDFVDNNVQICANMFNKRCTTYRKLGYPIVTKG